MANLIPKMMPLGPPPPDLPLDGMEQPLAKMPQIAQPQVTYAPDPQQQMIDHDQQQLQKVRWHEDNPWGTANNHPGTLGKIAHVLSVAGQIGGNIIAPNVVADIPGTQSNMRGNANALAERLGQETTAQGLDKEHAATTAKTEQDTALEPGKTQSTENYQDAETRKINDEIQQGPSLAAGYAHAVNQALKEGRDPSQDPIVQHISDAITSIQKQPADKQAGKDDQYIKILQDRNIAKGMNPTDAYAEAYKQYTKETKTDPGVSRMQVLVNGRGVQVVDPDNPESLTYDRLGHAIQSHAQAPGSIGYQTEKNVTKEFTTGTGAKNITAYNTAIAHLGMLQQAADALHNGDVQGLNRLGNEITKQTGNPAPTNFNAIKDAVAGEVSKTFKGGQATDAEIKQMNDSISAAQSPAQLKGVINTFTGLMNSKRDALKQQYEQGLHAQPNFNPTETRTYNGATYTKGADGQWHRQ